VIVLLTGGTGFVGRFVRARLLASGHRVIALARTQPAADDATEWRAADLSQRGFRLPVDERVDSVVALAQSRHYRAFPERARDLFDVNVAATLELLEWSRGAGCPRFVLASSANVYPRTRGPIAEDVPARGSSFYAASKRMAELLVESYASHLQGRVLRLFTVYGPGQRDALIPSLLERVREGRAVEIQGARGLRLGPVHVRDAARALVAAAVEPPLEPGFEIFNVGGSEAVDLVELAERIGRAAGRAPQFRFAPGDEPGGWIADAGRASARLGWKPEILLDEGLRELAGAPAGTGHA
jgi:nucleoside-diphosphate-sugar epimerase